ncbi:Cell division protein FtsI [Peptidoglycan synthetase] [[Actinomadura] parvosata subsp. kistnae]|uniref:penicillin-binding protein 2 n=1 Tax=[Actinomadura] parvosata TaxID=1955412 RepID=UPI000D282C25|nr:penicillin-binding protein 2 [Nonomuraea sp. ATCC 55076]SPL90546.1 Cell division protein FtsI [Peptidoglycan synthetase] [Actinomadura parvosata subsp. kistnae]
MSRGRLLVLRLVATAMLATLLGRLWFLQVVNGAAYVRAAADVRVRSVPLPPTRGQILDVTGRPLVTNTTRPVVTVDAMALAHQPDGGRAVLTRLGEALGRPYRQLAEKVRLCGPSVPQPCWQGSPYEPIPVARDVSVPVALQISERQQDFPGVRTEPRPIRVYPYGRAAAHTLGYVQGAKGRDGLEAAYDRDLAGRAGRTDVAVDNTGRVTRTIRQEPPVPGDTLVTSIDARVQAIAEQALGEALASGGGSSGAAVVLESATGRVVALAGRPAYDPSVWTDGVTAREYRALPLLSQAVQGEWAPGSTWKVTSAAAAAAAGYGLGATYDCPPGYTVGDRVFRNFAGADLGPMTMHGALVRSCDTIFYRLADRLWRRGSDALQRTARGFGFGRPTGVDLPGEAAGAVPDAASKRAQWRATRAEICRRSREGYPEMGDRARAAYLTELARENCRGGGVWRGGDAANFAIGQGGVLVTPLQLARAYAAVANGGTLYSPRVGLKVVRPGGTTVRTITPPVTGRLPASDATLRFLRQALGQVPRTGTAAGAFKGFPFGRIAVAGKTGTAESFGRRDTSWFASFAPDPGYTVVVVLSEGGRGAEGAAPAARAIWEGILGLRERR